MSAPRITDNNPTSQKATRQTSPFECPMDREETAELKTNQEDRHPGNLQQCLGLTEQRHTGGQTPGEPSAVSGAHRKETHNCFRDLGFYVVKNVFTKYKTTLASKPQHNIILIYVFSCEMISCSIITAA